MGWGPVHLGVGSPLPYDTVNVCEQGYPPKIYGTQLPLPQAIIDARREAFTRRLRAMGIRDRPIAPRSPWQNGYVERSIGSIRRECLDHVIIWGEAHLRQVLKAYTAYYNATRTHLGIDKDAPNCRPIERCGVIVANAVLGGLHHRYARI